MKGHLQTLMKCRKQDIQYVVIGTSAGGFDVLKKILPNFKKPSSLSVMIVIHVLPEKPSLLVPLLKNFCDFETKEMEFPIEIVRETIYFAPPDYHLSVESNGNLSLSNEPAINFSRPSIDVLFDSAAYAFGSKVLGILLTGASHDGANGLRKIKEHGGVTVVQSPESAEFSTMPRSALDLFTPDFTGDPMEISALINDLCVYGRKNGD